MDGIPNGAVVFSPYGLYTHHGNELLGDAAIFHVGLVIPLTHIAEFAPPPPGFLQNKAFRRFLPDQSTKFEWAFQHRAEITREALSWGLMGLSFLGPFFGGGFKGNAGNQQLKHQT